MTTNQKIIVTVASLVIIGGATYLIWDYTKKNKKPEVKTDPPSTPVTPSTPSAPVPTSAYGLKYGDQLWSKANVVNVYNYPSGETKYRVGFIKKSATPQARFLEDATTKGWIKVKSAYFLPSGLSQTMGDVYVQGSEVTNVKP
jgi:Flp pilus assembly protein CpaB